MMIRICLFKLPPTYKNMKNNDYDKHKLSVEDIDELKSVSTENSKQALTWLGNHFAHCEKQDSICGDWCIEVGEGGFLHVEGVIPLKPRCIHVNGFVPPKGAEFFNFDTDDKTPIFYDLNQQIIDDCSYSMVTQTGIKVDDDFKQTDVTNLKPRNVVHLRYGMQSAYENGVNIHPQKAMDDIGIKYTHSTPQSMSDSWWFWNCENVPDPLPEYLKELKVEPSSCVGWGLSAREAQEINNYNI